ncbi:helix-turn-helix domain-containing protein [Lactococcus lactis]|jgi:transcriptional regulator with XRE-family HTH domain|uniref:helix-turn-helix domain-containing protein n=1 Tax=Lactococcus lactis TaxID=1358 RepID=UPI0018ABD4FA|nr:helix-turn-helix transcriptional regulator [Lactococcus lactis]
MIKDRLKTVRLEQGYTQKEIADKLGVSQPNYQQWERGVRNPKDTTLSKIADILGVSLDYLKGRDTVIDLAPYEPTEEDLKAIKSLIDNYFQNRDKL